MVLIARVFAYEWIDSEIFGSEFINHEAFPIVNIIGRNRIGTAPGTAERRTTAEKRNAHTFTAHTVQLRFAYIWIYGPVKHSSPMLCLYIIISTVFFLSLLLCAYVTHINCYCWKMMKKKPCTMLLPVLPLWTFTLECPIDVMLTPHTHALNLPLVYVNLSHSTL